MNERLGQGAESLQQLLTTESTKGAHSSLGEGSPIGGRTDDMRSDETLRGFFGTMGSLGFLCILLDFTLGKGMECLCNSIPAFLHSGSSGFLSLF